MKIFDDTPCQLGEGPLWHPLRQSLFWLDILGNRMFERAQNAPSAREIAFDENVSAAAWLDEQSLIVASETQISHFNIESRAQTRLVDLEADNPLTRSNDGRADPYGGFWIGTMGKNSEKNAGAIYRFYQGELRQLYAPITIPNAICFSPEGDRAYFCDTTDGRVMRVTLDTKGWPKGEPEVYLDLRSEPFGVDGAVIDTKGNFWNAQWGAGRLACYSPDGKLLEAFALPTLQVTCPSFGGDDFSTIFVTSATVDLAPEDAKGAGLTYQLQTKAKGQTEHAFRL